MGGEGWRTACCRQIGTTVPCSRGEEGVGFPCCRVCAAVSRGAQPEGMGGEKAWVVKRHGLAGVTGRRAAWKRERKEEDAMR